MQNITAIILAGGKGKRMNADRPKQYLELGGRALLCHTVDAFIMAGIDRIVIVCGEGEEDYVKTEILEKTLCVNAVITVGGAERYDSVYNGLLACPDAEYVLIHDGARCCISPEMIKKMMAEARDGRSMIAAVPVKDTIKMAEQGIVTETLPRQKLYAVQTPQGFLYSDILSAHRLMREDASVKEQITDDAMIMEYFSDKKVYIVEGEDTNIKITTASDLILAESILRRAGRL